MKELIIFGVGGILLKDEANPLVDILGLLGKWSAGLKIHEEYERRKEKGPWGLAQYAELYCCTTKENLITVATEYLSGQIRPGAQNAIRKLKERGYIVGIISAYPDFIMEALKDMFDMDFSEGTNFEYKDGVPTGRIAREVNRNNKCEILKEVSEHFGVMTDHVSTVANSITQVSLIEKVGRYVAFNQTRLLGYKPDFEVRDGDLGKLLEIFP